MDNIEYDDEDEREEIESTLKKLSALKKCYTLDVDVCPTKHRAFEDSQEEGTILSHRISLCCMKCSKIEINNECYLCLLKHCCEICAG